MKHPSGLVIHVVAAESATLPCYASQEAAGADLCAFLPEGPVSIPSSGGRALVPTGLVLEIPHGYEGQVRPRSGLANRYGVTVLNSPGTIDSDYRGEVKVILINHGNDPFEISHGQRIAQLVIAPVVQCGFIQTETTSNTERGEQGFGSTGV
ncbi:MAG: dUTP diphosphatase [Sphaerochaetaceae bacterium]